MPRYQRQRFDSPMGFSKLTDLADLPENRVQEMKGLLPARFGKARAALPPKFTKDLGVAIAGLANWRSATGTYDKLLIWDGQVLHSTPLANTNTYRPYADKQHQYITLGSLTTVYDYGTPVTGAFRTIQFGTELIISIGGAMQRYYVAEADGTEHFYNLGMAAPVVSSTTLAGTTGGSMTSGQTYHYVAVYGDEAITAAERLSSPSSDIYVTLTSAQNAVVLANLPGIGAATTGESHIYVCRKNPGSTTYNLVHTSTSATTWGFTDTTADTAVGTDTAPEAGENDPPNRADIMTVWKNRLVLNDIASPRNIQISNTGSPTQFSVFPLPTSDSDGTTIITSGPDAVTGLQSLGSILTVLKHDSILLVLGDSPTNSNGLSPFTVRPQHQRGCHNPDSVIRTENEVMFLSDDGIYKLLYASGYVLVKASADVDDQFKGFAATVTPVPDGVPSVEQSVPLLIDYSGGGASNVTSFYFDNRYYVSVPNKTLVYDVLAGDQAGWADAGYGLIKALTVYEGPNLPPSIFMAFGSTTQTQTYLYYFTINDTSTDPDAPSTWPISFVDRPYDGEGPARERIKRAKRLTFWGTTDKPVGEKIGTATFITENGFVEDYDVLVGDVITASSVGAGGNNILFQIDPTPLIQGRLPYVRYSFDDPSLVIQERMLEYQAIT